MNTSKKILIILKKITCLILVFILISSVCACKEQIYDTIGAPSTDKFSKGEPASSPWDLCYFNGKIYLGSGDYNVNTGPTDIWAYNLQTLLWEKTGTLQEEAVTRFVVLDEKLVALGADSTQDWSFGSFYLLNNQKWIQYRNIPNAVHVFDMIEFDNKLFAGIGTEYNALPILVSQDKGLTFNPVPMIKDDKPYDLSVYAFSRAYEFFTFNEQLNVLTRHYLQDDYQGERKYVCEIFRYENGKMYYHSNADFFTTSTNVGVNLLNAKGVFEDTAYFASNYLYSSQDLKNFTRIDLPEKEFVSDFFILDDVMYVLGYKPISDKTFSVVIYSTKNIRQGFYEIKSFEYPVPPLSFVLVNENFYLGMGNKTNTNKHNGTVLKVKL